MQVGKWATAGVIVALLMTPAAAEAGAAPAAPGWVVDRARFEPLDTPLSVLGTGDYRGAIDVLPRGRAVSVVNEVGLDDYVKGISEVPVSWPVEAQKAQAIAARTYALWQMARTPRDAVAHICATQACQVYVGLAKERRPGAQSWTSAVEATSGHVIVWRGGPIMAKYSSTNGGRSVAGSAPYLRAVDDRDDAVSPYHRWQVALPLPTLAGIFTPPGDLVAVTRIGDGVVFDWTGPDGTPGQLVVPVVDFRTRVNAAVPASAGLPLTLPSVRFDMTSVDGVATAIGGGWGHGVGMSQYGALGKALRGMRAADIIASYYAGLRPVVVPPEQLPTTIRIALDEGRASAAVSGGNRFRVLDGAGNVIALAARGTWKVVPAGNKAVRILPPTDQAGGPGVDQVGLERAVARLGEPGRLHLRLAAPAALQLVVQLPAAPPAVTELGVRDAGTHVLDVPAATLPGAGQVTVRADAGGGRTTVVPLAFEVARPRPPAPVAAVDGLPAVEPGRHWLSTLAVALLLAVAAGLVRGHRQLH